MKKSFFVAGFVVWAMAASAQVTDKKEPPPPPSPPKPSTSKVKHVPPPPPPAEPLAPEEPPPAPEPPMPPQERPEDYVAFLKKNPTVESLAWNADDEVIVRLKSGKEERYNLNDEKGRKAVETKYGKLPVAPPPPPPPPPPPDAPEPPAKKTKKKIVS